MLAANYTRVHMNHTTHHHFYADLGMVHRCVYDFGKQRSNHPNESNPDINRTWVHSKSASVKVHAYDSAVIPHSYVVACRHPKCVGHSWTQMSEFVVPLASEVTFSEIVVLFALIDKVE